MKYIDADKLRADIKRRITDNTFGAKLELMDILSFLDTLEEPVSYDLEEAADDFTNDEVMIQGEFRGESVARKVKKAFKAGAEWMKAKMMKEGGECL